MAILKQKEERTAHHSDVARSVDYMMANGYTSREIGEQM